MLPSGSEQLSHHEPEGFRFLYQIYRTLYYEYTSFAHNSLFFRAAVTCCCKV